MGRKNSSAYNKELNKIIAEYEAAKSEDRPLYLDADQLANIADRYASERKFKEAQEVIEYGLHLHSENTDLLIEQAYLYLDTHKIHLAKEVVERITEDYNTEVKMLKAEILLNEGLLENAEEILNSIEEQDELEFIIDIVYLYLDMGYPENAKEWLDKGKSAYKDEEDYIAVTADYLSSTNQLDEASVYYNRLIDIDPYNATYWVGLAKCRFIAEDCENAIEACDFALAADDNCGEAYMYRAHCYFYLNNSDAAIADYKKSIEFKAIPPEMGYMFIGMAYSNKDEWKEANEYYQKVYDSHKEKGDGKSPLLIDTFVNWAISTFNLGNSKEAHELCKKARTINPKESVIYLTEGKFYLKEDLDKKAFQCFKTALKDDPSAEMWYLVGDAYSETGLFPEAKKCYEEVYKQNPSYPDIAKKLSILCLMHNDLDEFFKYNSECENPLTEDNILNFLTQQKNTDEERKALEGVLERMRKEKGK